jgi:hypothetical protein
MAIELFPREKIIGIFRGFQEGGLEFHADLVLPYRNEFQSIPMHGQFLLVQLETPNEAVLGRITSFSPEGKLSSGSGDEFNIRAVRDHRPVPEDLREQYLRYRVNIRVLGVLRSGNGDRLTYVPSVRRLPHVGSPVAFPSEQVLQDIAGHNIEGAPIGYFALGEYVYAPQKKNISVHDWMQFKSPEVLIRFPVENLVSRRSFIFARAGFGKSNLNKLLFSTLYKKSPKIPKRNREAPVGTVIFDPDGEYFWPDDKGRPGLCDVPELEDKLVVFTPRKSSSPFYQSFVAGGVKLDIRRLNPSDVISIALSPEKQDQQNVRKLRGLHQDAWEKLVDLIYKEGNQADQDKVMALLNLEKSQEAEALAARANMTAVVKMLHDPTSQLMDMLLYALGAGKLCVVDVSQMRGGQAMVLSGLILRRIFDHNQAEFTEAEPRTIPTIAVIEEAQSVLNEKSTSSEPFISWVKEGRKYDLGAVMVTQQPGSIPVEILSQGDNWFIFHLLSAADLISLKRANAHFSDDLLTAILNEPIAGQGVFWSSVGGKPYPVAIRVLSFENMYKMLDEDYSNPAAQTFAAELKEKVLQGIRMEEEGFGDGGDGRVLEEGPAIDMVALVRNRAIEALRANNNLMTRIKNDGVAWGAIKGFFLDNGHVPATMDNADGFAYNLVRTAMDEIFGENGWHSFKKPGAGGKDVTYVKQGRAN